jgi:hypothetical protein
MKDLDDFSSPIQIPTDLSNSGNSLESLPPSSLSSSSKVSSNQTIADLEEFIEANSRTVSSQRS